MIGKKTLIPKSEGRPELLEVRKLVLLHNLKHDYYIYDLSGPCLSSILRLLEKVISSEAHCQHVDSTQQPNCCGKRK